MGLPVYIFTDADPWGMHIAIVIISGSANAAHVKELTTPDAKWAGTRASDIVNYKLPNDKLDDIDIRRLHELMHDPKYNGDIWQREINMFMRGNASLKPFKIRTNPYSRHISASET